MRATEKEEKRRGRREKKRTENKRRIKDKRNRKGRGKTRKEKTEERRERGRRMKEKKVKDETNRKGRQRKGMRGGREIKIKEEEDNKYKGITINNNQTQTPPRPFDNITMPTHTNPIIIIPINLEI